MTVRLSGRRGLPRVDRRRLRSLAGRILRSLDLRDAELSVTLVDDADMAALARSVAKPGIKDRIAAFRAAAAKR